MTKLLEHIYKRNLSPNSPESDVLMGFDVHAIRRDFPILSREVNGKPLVYLDNGATTQKPQSVIDVLNRYYSNENSNIHRGVHYLSQAATDAYEQARKKIQVFINAKHEHEVIFTKGTTDSINLIADTFGRTFLQKGDEVIITAMEHHSNIVPWQMACEYHGAVLKFIPMNEKGELLMDELDNLLTEKTKIISVVHVSNSLGTINPIETIIEKAHHLNIPVVVDGAQAIQHMKINVQALDVDFYVFSGHKIFGPTGVGILYGKEKWLEKLPPYQGGGDMIKEVTLKKTTYNDLPHKFEAGTPHIAGGIGLGASIDYVNKVGIENIASYEAELLAYAKLKMSAVDDIQLIGTAAKKSSVMSFLINGTHPFDVGTILDKLGIAVRTGHHCTQPIMDQLGIPGTARATFAFYNTKEEIDILVDGINRAAKMLR